MALKHGLFIIDSVTGKTLGQLEGDADSFMRFAFHPNGKQLVGFAMSHLQVWDLTTGQRTADLSLPQTLGADEMQWVDDDYLLARGKQLVDIKRGIVLWTYDREGIPLPSGQCGGKYWFLLQDTRRNKGLAPAKLPDPAALKAVESMTPEQLLAVGPGSEVGLRVEIDDATPEEQRQVFESLVARLKANGMRPVRQAEVTLVASRMDGDTKDITYRTLGSLRNRETTTTQVTPRISQLAFEKDGKQLWVSKHVVGAPLVLRRKAGQTIEAALDERRNQKQNVAFFLNAELPKQVMRQSKTGSYGRSRVTAQGIQVVSQPGQSPGPGQPANPLQPGAPN